LGNGSIGDRSLDLSGVRVGGGDKASPGKEEVEEEGID